MKREHETDMPHCWCNPTKIGHANGVIHIIHNEPEENCCEHEPEEVSVSDGWIVCKKCKILYIK